MNVAVNGLMLNSEGGRRTGAAKTACFVFEMFLFWLQEDRDVDHEDHEHLPPSEALAADARPGR